MKTIEQIQKGIAAYLDNELMPQLPANGIEKVLAGTALSLAIRKSGTIMEGLKENKSVKMLGIMDEEGSIDVDVLTEELKKNVPIDGVKIDIPMIGGVTFHKDDVDKIHEYIGNV